MKFSNQFLPHVIVLILVIVAVLVCFVPCVVPYSRGASYATYEGFDEQNPADVMKDTKEKADEKQAEIDGNVKAESETAAIAAAAPVSESFAGLGSLGNLISVGGNISGKESFGSFLGNVFGGAVSTTGFAKKEGFEANDDTSMDPYSGPVSNYDDVLDKFSQVKTFGQDGVNGCTSSGLSNSKGYLCLTPDLISALKTRGGNAV